MPSKDSLLPKRLLYPLRCMLFLLATCLWVGSASAKLTVQASKDCSTTPCTVVEAQFTTVVAQTITWTATYTGGPTDGHSFYLSTVGSNMADIPLTTSGQASGSQFLQPGTYYISIKTFLMGPGFYSVTYGPTSSGEPHITTINGMHYLTFKALANLSCCATTLWKFRLAKPPFPPPIIRPQIRTTSLLPASVSTPRWPPASVSTA